jgi:hypothetical protein
MAVDTYDAIIGVNLRGAFVLLQKSIAQMLKMAVVRSLTPHRWPSFWPHQDLAPISARKAVYWQSHVLRQSNTPTGTFG